MSCFRFGDLDDGNFENFIAGCAHAHNGYRAEPFDYAKGTLRHCVTIVASRSANNKEIYLEPMEKSKGSWIPYFQWSSLSLLPAGMRCTLRAGRWRDGTAHSSGCARLQYGGEFLNPIFPIYSLFLNPFVRVDMRLPRRK